MDLTPVLALLKPLVKDAIIIAGDLIPVLRDEWGKTIEVPEQTAAGLIAALRAAQTPPTPRFLPHCQKIPNCCIGAKCPSAIR